MHQPSRTLSSLPAGDELVNIEDGVLLLVLVLEKISS
jgi:hypothetical protein